MRDCLLDYVTIRSLLISTVVNMLQVQILDKCVGAVNLNKVIGLGSHLQCTGPVRLRSTVVDVPSLVYWIIKLISAQPRTYLLPSAATADMMNILIGPFVINAKLPFSDWLW